MSQRKRLNQRKRQQRRKVLPGFPWEGTFETKEAVDAYFAGDKIQCLLCGKWYQDLSSSHLLRIHGTTPDAYRERYGLPWSRGLTSASLRQRNREQMLQRIEEGFVPSFFDADFRRSIGRPTSQRSPQPYAVRRSSRKLLEARGRTTPWQPEDYERILQRMQEQQRILSDVCKDPDLPSIARWQQFVKKHPEFADKLQQVYYTLPYAVQLRGRGKVSPQFRIDCQRLRDQGLSYEKIATTLGVSVRTVFRYLHKRR